MLEDDIQVQDAPVVEHETQTAVRLPNIKYVKSRGFFTRKRYSRADRITARKAQRAARRNNR